MWTFGAGGAQAHTSHRSEHAVLPRRIEARRWWVLNRSLVHLLSVVVRETSWDPRCRLLTTLGLVSENLSAILGVALGHRRNESVQDWCSQLVIGGSVGIRPEGWWIMPSPSTATHPEYGIRALRRTKLHGLYSSRVASGGCFMIGKVHCCDCCCRRTMVSLPE